MNHAIAHVEHTEANEQSILLQLTNSTPFNTKQKNLITHNLSQALATLQ